jgi:hypothetical protein
MWSIAEYADHLRKVLFGMHFLLDTAVTTPGADLGKSPSSPFDPEPCSIDITTAARRKWFDLPDSFPRWK